MSTPHTMLPKLLPPNAALPHGIRHAVIFSDPRGFTNDLYTLAVEAVETEAYGQDRCTINVLGVHTDWLTPAGAIGRAVFLETGSKRLVECEWDQPIKPDSAQFLNLGPAERTLHPWISGDLAVPQINPHPSSALADDKAATLAAWLKLGIETPHSGFLEAAEIDRAPGFAAGLREIVIKPNEGTEGRGVVYLRATERQLRARLEDYFENSSHTGRTLIQERRDGIVFTDPATDREHSLVLRLNLIFDGSRFQLSSGYAQIGRTTDTPAAIAHGGRIITLYRAMASLAPREGKALPISAPDEAWWRNLAGMAERAAACFDGLMLAGLDVVLDLGPDGRLIPVFLEANPRPAGLCRSRLLDGTPSHDDQAGVGAGLWRGLQMLVGDRHRLG